MNNHSRILLILLVNWISFFAFGANEECRLTEKDNSTRKYQFVCGKDKITVQCRSKSEGLCKVQIMSDLMAASFDISDDKFKSMEVFDEVRTAKVACESELRSCSLYPEVCEGYKKTTAFLRGRVTSEDKTGKHCDQFGFGSIEQTGQIGNEVLKSSPVSIDDCGNNSAKIEAVASARLSLLEEELMRPTSSPDGFFTHCSIGNKILQPEEREAYFKKILEMFSGVQKKALNLIRNKNELSRLVCQPGLDLITKTGEIDTDKLTCVVVEESRIGQSKQASEIRFACGDKDPRNHVTNPNGARNSGLIVARDTEQTAEQMERPKEVGAAMNAPMGLAPALTKIDQIVPNGDSDSESRSEKTISTGAVRSAIPNDIALEAGHAIAPVYRSLKNIVGSVTRDVALIGSNKKEMRQPNSLSSTQVLPGEESDASSAEQSTISGALANNLSTAGGGPSKLTTNKAAMKIPNINEPEIDSGQSALRGGATGISASPQGVGGGSIGGSPSRNTQNIDGVFSSEKIMQRLSVLTDADQIKTFFISESKNIPGLRDSIYKNEDIKNLLDRKKIKIVGNNGKVSGAKTKDAKFIFSDNGKDFLPLTLKAK